MSKIDLYIARHVLGAILAVVFIVVGLDLLFALVDQLEDSSDRYGMPQIAHYLALTAPRRIYEFLPLSSLVGCLIGLGILASSSELTVMRAAGVSTRQIVFSVMKPVGLLVVLGLVLGEYVVPVAEQRAQSERALAQSAGEALNTRHGIWHREGLEYIHINAVDAEGRIHGVTRYRFNDAGEMLSASFAAKGEFDLESGSWLLSQLRTTEFQSNSTRVSQQDKEKWQSGLTPERLAIVVVEPVNLAISGLWAYSGYLEEQGLSASTYQLAFWSKLLQPLAIAALVLIAISFIFGPLRSVTIGQRILTGIIVGLIFKFAQDLLGPASTVFGFTPLVAVLLPIVVCTAAGAWMLRKAG